MPASALPSSLARILLPRKNTRGFRETCIQPSTLVRIEEIANRPFLTPMCPPFKNKYVIYGSVRQFTLPETCDSMERRIIWILRCPKMLQNQLLRSGCGSWRPYGIHFSAGGRCTMHDAQLATHSASKLGSTPSLAPSFSIQHIGKDSRISP